MSEAFSLWSPRPSLADSMNGPILSCCSFTFDLSEAKDAPNLKAIEASLRHQIDFVAEYGTKAEILCCARWHRLRS